MHMLHNVIPKDLQDLSKPAMLCATVETSSYDS